MVMNQSNRASMNEAKDINKQLMDKIVLLTERARKQAIAIAIGEARQREQEKEWEKLRRVA